MYKNISLLIFFSYFLLSGYNKINNFHRISKGFMNKINTTSIISQFLIFLAILLEIVGSLIIISNNLIVEFPELIMHFTYLTYLLFLILVTLIYHPYKKEPYKFLANTSLFGAILFFYIDYLFSCDMNILIYLN
tara:strand:- start:5145 stop:5546 length:402 start_codon:yes stop_codon:yes gene_type:complete